MTLTDIVQFPFAGTVRPAGNVTVLEFAAAMIVAPPPQVVLPFGTGATRTPPGSVSTKLALNVAIEAF